MSKKTIWDNDDDRHDRSSIESSYERFEKIKNKPIPFSWKDDTDLNRTSIDLSFHRLEEIPAWLKKYKKVQHLNLSMNFLTNLPITFFEDFPELISFNCSFNLLRELPPFLSSGPLSILKCFMNQLEKISSPLPDNLEMLDCTYNRLTKLPFFNKNLHTISCSYNSLEYFPPIGQKVRAIHCSDNDLFTIPCVPDTVESFSFRYNPRIDVLEGERGDALRNLASTLYRFVHLFHALKFRQKFLFWRQKSQETKKAIADV